MLTSMVELLRGGVPALIALGLSVAVIRVVCRRPLLRRLSLALSLGAAAGSLGLFRALAPQTGELVQPYLRFLALFALAYAGFKVVEIVVADLLPGRERGSAPPAIVRDVVAVLVGGLIAVVLLRASFGVDVTALVATSAALSIVIGLALQETLANLFAGLALMLERPFEPGDWVKIGELVGRVEEISWRAVRLKLIRQEDYLVVPNSVVAKSEIVNMSQPLPVHGHQVLVAVGYGEPPNRVRQVLVEAVRDMDGVLAEPAPRSRIIRFDSSAVLYELVYYLQDFARVNALEGEALARVWYAFRRHGITAPFPTTNVQFRDAAQTEREVREREVDDVARLLHGVDFLEALTTSELKRVAGETRRVPYPGGMAVVRQGETGDSLFVIASGAVQVDVRTSGSGADQVLAILGPGSYFGEMSLLTGAPRSATIRTMGDTELVVLGQDALRPLLVGDPAVAERLSKTLARRQAERDTALHRTPADAPGHQDQAGQLLDRIRWFFGLGGSVEGPRPGSLAP